MRDVLHGRSTGLIGFGLHETEAAGAVQRAIVRSHRSLRTLVPAVSAEPTATGRDHGGAEPERRSRHDLVQRYAPELNRRCRPEVRKTDRSWRVDETYLRVAGKWTYLYRAVNSTGATIDFPPSTTRDAVAAKRFLKRALRSPGHPRPRVINVDGNPSYPKVIAELKHGGELGRRCRCRPVRYLNNILEQNHRAIK